MKGDEPPAREVCISAMYLVLRSSFSGCDIVFSIGANPFDKVCPFHFYM